MGKDGAQARLRAFVSWIEQIKRQTDYKSDLAIARATKPKIHVSLISKRRRAVENQETASAPKWELIQKIWQAVDIEPPAILFPEYQEKAGNSPAVGTQSTQPEDAETVNSYQAGGMEMDPDELVAVDVLADRSPERIAILFKEIVRRAKAKRRKVSVNP